jgi:hypothetical protein
MKGKQGSLTVITLELHLLGNLVVDLLVLILASSESDLALDGSGGSSSSRAELFGGLLGSSAGSEEEISGPESRSSDTKEDVGRGGLSGRGRGRLGSQGGDRKASFGDRLTTLGPPPASVANLRAAS